MLHQNQWVDVPPTPGALVVNIGDLLQVILTHSENNWNFFRKNEYETLFASKTNCSYSGFCFFSSYQMTST